MSSAKREKIDGWLLLDKPLGLTSTQALGRVRRAFNAAKGGHAGTLDPLATGVLPIALGEATKTLPYLVDGDKEYEFTARWGIATATDDREGAVVATSEIRPTDGQIRAVLGQFVGQIDQTPPVYSAIKIDGERAYARARAGEEVAMKSRRVLIHKLEYLGAPDAETGLFRVASGKGMYVRSLARDLAQALGTCAHVTELRRTAVGRFRLDTAISLEKLEGFGHSPARFGVLAPVATVLDDIPALAVTAEQAAALRRGQALRDPRVEPSPLEAPVLVVYCDGKLVALAASDGATLRPTRVFNL